MVFYSYNFWVLICAENVRVCCVFGHWSGFNVFGMINYAVQTSFFSIRLRDIYVYVYVERDNI